MEEIFTPNKFVGAVLMDLSKAFDCIFHDLLIAKMHAYRFSLESLTFCYSYIKDVTNTLKLMIYIVFLRYYYQDTTMTLHKDQYLLRFSLIFSLTIYFTGSKIRNYTILLMITLSQLQKSLLKTLYWESRKRKLNRYRLV